MLIYMYYEHHQTIFVLDVLEERKKNQFLIRFTVVYMLPLTLRNRLQLGIFWREILLLLF